MDRDRPPIDDRDVVIVSDVHLGPGLDPETALQALPRAQQFLEAQSGACLWGATIGYLGAVGALSPVGWTAARTRSPGFPI